MSGCFEDKGIDAELEAKVDRLLEPEAYGKRPTDGMGLFEPQELGYRCPEGHAHITWSEFNEHIWCYECEKDFHYAKQCVLVEDECNPKNLPEQPRIIKGVKNWTEDGNGWNDIPKEKLEERK
jgi:hypothetical protein